MLTTTQKRLKKLEALKFCILLKAQLYPAKTKINLESQLAKISFFIKSSAKSNRFTIELFRQSDAITKPAPTTRMNLFKY